MAKSAVRSDCPAYTACCAPYACIVQGCSRGSCHLWCLAAASPVIHLFGPIQACVHESIETIWHMASVVPARDSLASLLHKFWTCMCPWLTGTDKSDWHAEGGASHERDLRQTHLLHTKLSICSSGAPADTEGVGQMICHLAQMYQNPKLPASVPRRETAAEGRLLLQQIARDFSGVSRRNDSGRYPRPSEH